MTVRCGIQAAIRPPRIIVIVLVLVALSSGTFASATTALPTLASVHMAPFPATSLASQDSCSMNQYSNPKLPSVYRLDLRGFEVDLIGPIGWTCLISDGNGSGASILMAHSTSFPFGPRGNILLDASANTTDNGANFCPYTSAFPPAFGSCRGHTARPRGEEVQYLYGNATTKSAAVLVADPAGDRTPFSGIATEPTTTVLAAASRGGAYDLACTIDTTLSPFCMTDAARFVTAYEHVP